MTKNRILIAVLAIVMIIFLAPVVSAETGIYYVKQGDTLWIISQKYDVPVNTLMELNDLEDYTIYIGQKLYIRRVITYPQKDGRDYSNPHRGDWNNSGDDQSDWFVYTIKRGDTLWGLSRKYGVSLSGLIEINDIQNSHDLYVGRRLIIPTRNYTTRPQTPEPQGFYTIYEVKEGDRIWNIAYRFGTTVYKLLKLNNLEDVNNIEAGTKLLIRLDDPDHISRYAKKVNRVYRVKPGDTLEKIGEFFGIEPRFIRLINGLREDAPLYPGKRLLMPVNEKLFVAHDYYLVNKDREYLFDIAYYYGISVQSIIKANYYSDLNKSVSKGTIVLVPLDKESRVYWKSYDGSDDHGWF